MNLFKKTTKREVLKTLLNYEQITERDYQKLELTLNDYPDAYMLMLHCVEQYNIPYIKWPTLYQMDLSFLIKAVYVRPQTLKELKKFNKEYYMSVILNLHKEDLQELVDKNAYTKKEIKAIEHDIRYGVV